MDIPISQADERTADDKNYYGFTTTISAKEMTDVVSSQYFYTGGTSAVKEYSVKEYAGIILTDTSGNANIEKVKPLVKAMLIYGAYAQIHFGYNTDNLACDLNDADVSGVTAKTLSSFANSAAQGTELVPFGGSSLILKTETTMCLFFMPGENVSNLTITRDGSSLDVTNKSGYSYVNIAGIAAKDLDNNYTVTVNDGAATANMTYNPMTYCYNVMNAEEGAYNNALLNAVRAL